MWAVPKIVFDFFRKRRRKQEEALTNQAGKQDQKQGNCLVLEGEILLLACAPASWLPYGASAEFCQEQQLH
jgi:hypothetical protein